MAKDSHILQKGAVLQHIAKAHPERSPASRKHEIMNNHSLGMLNCRTLSSELSTCLGFCEISCRDADEDKVGGCAIAVRNDYNNLVEEFDSTSSRCAFARLRDRRGRKLWIVSAYAPMEIAEDNNRDAFYGELNALISKIPSQQVVIVGIDANAKMELEQQSDVLGK
ncbi:hypothetical protein RB195_019736 [Necator americanus]|uniref:Uncharacterized protein n=1 Tax=Necator americanus TaxID=51031 RepID=A0ABR1CH53_NECAM